MGPPKSWWTPLSSVPQGKMRAAWSWDIQSASPLGTIVWDQDKVLGPIPQTQLVPLPMRYSFDLFF